jgi:hypothetical protein
MRFSISHNAPAPLSPTHGVRSATYLPASGHRAPVVGSGEVHSRDLSVYSLIPVAAGEVVAVVVARCSPLVERAGSAEAVVVLDSAEGVVGSTARCMPRSGNTGFADAVSDPDLVELASSTHSCLVGRHIADHFPNLRAAHSGRCPIARFHPGRSHNRNIAGRNGHRTPGTAAVAVSAVGVLDRSIAVAAVRGCIDVPFWRRYREAPPTCLSMFRLASNDR